MEPNEPPSAIVEVATHQISVFVSIPTATFYQRQVLYVEQKFRCANAQNAMGAKQLYHYVSIFATTKQIMAVKIENTTTHGMSINNFAAPPIISETLLSTLCTSSRPVFLGRFPYTRR